MATFDKRKEYINEFRNVLNYLIIGAVSIISSTVIPMLGSSLGLKWNFPTTAAGWIVWSLMRLLSGLLNIIIFICFMRQAKVNVKDDPNFKKANEILNKEVKEHEVLPRSPKSWSSFQYGFKGGTIFIFTVISAIGLTQAILAFNLLDFISTIFTVSIGIIFGVMQMTKAEDYWTSEYLEYAMRQKRLTEEKEDEKNIIKSQEPSIPQSREEVDGITSGSSDEHDKESSGN